MEVLDASLFRPQRFLLTCQLELITGRNNYRNTGTLSSMKTPQAWCLEDTSTVEAPLGAMTVGGTLYAPNAGRGYAALLSAPCVSSYALEAVPIGAHGQ